MSIVHEARHIVFEGLVNERRGFRFERSQVPHAMAAKASAQTRTRNALIETLASDCQKVIQGKKQCAAQGTRRSSLGRRLASFKACERCARGPETSPATSTCRSLRSSHCSAGPERLLNRYLPRSPVESPVWCEFACEGTPTRLGNSYAFRAEPLD